MSFFQVPADAYDRFMGRYSVLLSPQFADIAGIAAGQRVLDVGCGPGALTAELVARLGSAAVSAIDPSEEFVAAARARYPEVAVEQGAAEQLPYPDRAFDAALAQLVVHFMSDAAAGVGEMKRVTRPGGIVAACVWDHGGGQGPLSPLWEAARALDPNVQDESRLMGSHEGDLARLFQAVGLSEVEETAIQVSVQYDNFDDWWEPFTFGVGPAGAYVAGLDADGQRAVREQCQVLLGPPPFAINARAWTGLGRS